MNGKEPLVFHDFFEYIGTKSEEKYQISTTDVDSSKGSGNRLTLVEETEVCVVSPDSASQVEESISPAILSGPFSAELQTSEEITSDQSLWRRENGNLQDKEKFMYTNRQHRQTETTRYKDFSQKQLEMNIDSSHTFKQMGRTEKSNDRKRGYQEMANEDLHLTMQPPRVLFKSSNLNSSSIPKMDVPALVPKKREISSLGLQSMELFGPSRVEQKNTQEEHMMRDTYTPMSIQLQTTPADEGSRTGLKGSNVGNLRNSRSGNQAIENMDSAFLTKPKSRSQGFDLESSSTFVTSHHMAPMTRQLTIFYGGLAHVFEDISSEKAEVIIELAGSNGRSWSTTYSPQSKSSMPLSGSEGHGGKNSGVSEHHTFLKSSTNAQTNSGRFGKVTETDKELFK